MVVFMASDDRLVQVPVDVLHALYDCWASYRMWFESNPAPDDEQGDKRVFVYTDFIDQIEESMAFFEPNATRVWRIITERWALDAAMNKLRDQKLLEREDLRESIEQMRRGEGREVSINELRRRIGERPAPTDTDWIQMEES